MKALIAEAGSYSSLRQSLSAFDCVQILVLKAVVSG